MSTVDSGPKVSTTARCAARGLDLSLVFLLDVVLPHPAGVLLGLLYTLLQDAMWGGQSLGKRLLKLRVRNVETNAPCSLRESALRNSTIGVAFFFGIIPFWGWIILLLLGIPLFIMEVYLMKNKPRGERLGDLMAETRVVQE